MRLFTAVSPSAAAVRALAGAVDAAAGAPGGPRWADRGLWHVTLVFLGEVDEAGLPRLRRELAGAATGRAPFTVRLAGAGTFPEHGRPQILWVGLDGEVDRLTGLARAVRRAARRGRVAVERRPFHPHLTVGRWRPAGPADRGVVDALAGHAGPEFAVDRFTLFRSHLPARPDGSQPRYEPLESWPLST